MSGCRSDAEFGGDRIDRLLGDVEVYPPARGVVGADVALVVADAVAAPIPRLAPVIRAIRAIVLTSSQGYPLFCLATAPLVMVYVTPIGDREGSQSSKGVGPRRG